MANLLHYTTVVLLNLVSCNLSLKDNASVEISQLGSMQCSGYARSDEQKKEPLEENEPLGCTSPWTYCDNGTCKCGNIRQNILQCDPHGSTLFGCYCVTFKKGTDTTEVGSCIFTCELSGKKDLRSMTAGHIILPDHVAELDELICGPFNRTGTLCGRCKNNTFPLAYSFDMNCVECPDANSNWWKFVLVAFLPLTVFFFLVLFFNINVTSSHFLGFIWYSQGVALPPFARVVIAALRHRKGLQTGARILLASYGLWNLDFFRSLDLGICLGTDVVQTLALDLAVGVYPLLLMLLSYFLIRLYDRKFRLLVVLWKPFHFLFGHLQSRWDIRTSLIDSFATFFLLSNVKFLSVSFDLLTPVRVYQLNSTSQEPTHIWRLYYDPELPYFGEKHLPYAILAIVMLTLFIVLPVALLVLYPFCWFQKFLNLFPLRWYVLHTFMDSFHGCYKNRTQPGTRDCRWFASVYFIARFFAVIIGGITFNAMFYPLVSILVTLVVLFTLFISPFKDDVYPYGTINVVFWLLLSLWYVGVTGLNSTDEYKNNTMYIYVYFVITVMLATLPLIYVSAIILHWMYSRRKFGWELVRRLCAWRQGYQPVS